MFQLELFSLFCSYSDSPCIISRGRVVVVVVFPKDYVTTISKDYVTTISKRKTKNSQATAVVAAELSDVIPRKYI